jgi:leader peptidase (prepilin peptidase) / N-methyltransferase
MDLWLAVVSVLAGLAVGSFLNVCIQRLPLGESVIHPGSRCPRCRTSLRWPDNVPIVSYMALRGRCRACRAPISAVYPVIELATAGVFLLHAWRFGLDPLLVPRLLFACALLVLFVVDLQHRLLPNAITVPGIVCGLLFALFLPPGWVSALLGIGLGGGVLLVIAEAYYRWRGEEGLGMGDVKMLAMIGAFLGWPSMLLTLVISSVLGALTGIGVLVSRKGDLKYALPLGTFLAIGALIASLAGDEILEWYLGFYS